MANWTLEQIAQPEEWNRLTEQSKDDEANAIWSRLAAEMGYEASYALLQFVEEREERKKATRKRKLFASPRHASKAIETWRCLNDYPDYEISSHGRVRARDRARPGDWLKPRRRWYYGKSVDFVVLKDRDGRRCERMVGWLLVAAGFLPKPKWKTASVE
jgi:hypothetical protein